MQHTYTLLVEVEAETTGVGLVVAEGVVALVEEGLAVQTALEPRVLAEGRNRCSLGRIRSAWHQQPIRRHRTIDHMSCFHKSRYTRHVNGRRP